MLILWAWKLLIRHSKSLPGPNSHKLQFPVAIDDLNVFIRSTEWIHNIQLDNNPKSKSQLQEGFVFQDSWSLCNMHTSQPNLPASLICGCLDSFLHTKAFCGEKALAGHRW